MITYICEGCHQTIQSAPYAELYDAEGRHRICSRRCLLAWLAAHPADVGEGPE